MHVYIYIHIQVAFLKGFGGEFYQGPLQHCTKNFVARGTRIMEAHLQV